MARLIDTGVRGARANVAFDRALVDAHGEGSSPETLRFLRFVPSALIGLHQVLAHEVRVDYCREQGIELARRITGGGGLYLDSAQLGWELALDRARFRGQDLSAIAATICSAAAAGLGGLGVAAAFRPRNDLEAGGRKIGGTGGFIDGHTVFFQGTVLVDFDATRMISVLRVPLEKLARRDLDDARRRVTSLRELLGRAPAIERVQAALAEGLSQGLGMSFTPGAPTAREEALANAHLEGEIGTDAFVHGTPPPESGDGVRSATLFTRGGALRADLRLDGAGESRVREVLLTGDFLVDPPRAVFDVEAALRGLPCADAPAAAEAFLGREGITLLGFQPGDFRAVLTRALSQLRVEAGGHLLRAHRLGARAGRAPTLVFLHDALGSARQWRDLPERLAAALDTEALVYDRWGAGDSEPLSLPHRADYLRTEALESLPEFLARCGVADCVLIGQSDGASIALACAGASAAAAEGDGVSPPLDKRTPVAHTVTRVRAVVALSPHLYREARTLDAIRSQIREFDAGDLRARLQRHHGAKTDLLFERLVQVWTAPAAARGWGLEEPVGQIRCPVLAIQGEDDEFFSVAQLDAIGRRVPQLERLRLAGCGHYPHLQARREVFAAIRDFVRLHCAPHNAGDGTP